MNNVKIPLLFLMSLTGITYAKIDLVTLPVRDAVQVTIYNSADLTLVRERRQLTLSEGINHLQFSWANTLIDPTSLEMQPIVNRDQIDVFDLSYPPRTSQLGVWRIHSDIRGKNAMEINYFTSGMSWRAFYMGTLSEDETTIRLQGYVRVTNATGEDYEKAQTRLIVGKVHLLDEVATLAKRPQAFGSPVGQDVGQGLLGLKEELREKGKEAMFFRWDIPAGGAFGGGGGGGLLSKKEVRKEGLSEYFLYTIEGQETIPNGWSKRLPSFDIDEVPVENLYKYEEERFGRVAVRFLSFTNDEAHKLGDTPIPGGLIKVYRGVDEEQHLSYEGQSTFKYIPVDEEVELNLGNVGNITVDPVPMDTKTLEYQFDDKGNISGWDEQRTFEVTVKNTRAVAAKVQIDRNFSTQYWTLTHAGDSGAYEKIDLDTVRFTLALPPASKKVFTYTLTTRHGTREQAK